MATLSKYKTARGVRFTDLTADFNVVIPDRDLWDRIIPASTDMIHLYMDGSNLNNIVGVGVYQVVVTAKYSPNCLSQNIVRVTVLWQFRVVDLIVTETKEVKSHYHGRIYPWPLTRREQGTLAFANPFVYRINLMFFRWNWWPYISLLIVSAQWYSQNIVFIYFRIALRALESVTEKSETVVNCCRSFNTIASSSL